MKYLITVFSLIFLNIGCSHSEEHDCLTHFEQKFGGQNSALLTEVNDQFKNVIKGYDGGSLADKYRTFLQDIASGFDKNLNYSSVDMQLVNQLSKANFDTLFYEYSYRIGSNGDSIKMVGTDHNAHYLNSLRQISCNEFVYQYVDAFQVAGDTSPVVLAGGVIRTFSDREFNDPLLQRFLAVEFYLYFLVKNSWA